MLGTHCIEPAGPRASDRLGVSQLEVIAWCGDTCLIAITEYRFGNHGCVRCAIRHIGDLDDSVGHEDTVVSLGARRNVDNRSERIQPVSLPPLPR